MAYLVKPFQKSDLVPAIEIALSRFAEMAALEAEVAALRPARDPQAGRAGEGRADGHVRHDRAAGASSGSSAPRWTTA